MRIDILTLFPEMFEPILGTSILGEQGKKDTNHKPYKYKEFARIT